MACGQTERKYRTTTAKSTISEHITNILNEQELYESSVVRKFRTTAADGKQYPTLFYALPMILAVGFRVRSQRGTQFRQWAKRHLHEYMVKGLVMDDERLKNPDGRPDYTTMDFWRDNADSIIQNNDFSLLQNKGSISHKQMEELALKEYRQFDTRRKAFEAKEADRQDEEELKRLETKIKNRGGR